MRGRPSIEALGPVAPGCPVTFRVGVLPESEGPYPLDPGEAEWSERVVGVVLASAHVDFGGSDQGRGTARGTLVVLRHGGCVPFEAEGVPREIPPGGLVTMMAVFDHGGCHAGVGERAFRVVGEDGQRHSAPVA